jgi:cation-transporting ATPase 13A3/4/5
MVGFVWTFAIKWNKSIRSIFYRRSVLRDASVVAVFVPTMLSASATVHEAGYISRLRNFLTNIALIANGIMAFLFSDPSRGKQIGTYHYCKVLVDPDGMSYFVFNFRRYIFDEEQQKFVPGVCHVGETIGDFDEQRHGLSSTDATMRHHLVGPNAIRMKKPNFFRTLYMEFSGLFYVYQAFMIWTWFPLWYYYMAIVWTIIVTTGGVTVSIFAYRNEKNLYRLTHISGQVLALRDGDFVEISQAEIVPGDVIAVKPGVTYCDMVLVSSAGLLVDESALTGESTPVQKRAIDPMDSEEEYSKIVHKKHTILAGTTVLESELENDFAIVTTTGSYTTRGELLRSIFSYQRHQFKFDAEVRFVILILFFYAIFGFAMVIYFIQDTVSSQLLPNLIIC